VVVAAAGVVGLVSGRVAAGVGRTLPAALAAFLLGLVPACVPPAAPPLMAAAPPSFPPLPGVGGVGVTDLPVWPQVYQATNGLRVVWEASRGGGLVAIVTMIGAGSAYDPRGKEGLAHFVEHLSFRARDAHGVSVWDRLRGLGAATINGGTDHDKVVFFEVVPAAQLAAVLRIEAERLVHPLRGVAPDAWETERNVVRNELRERNETGVYGQLLAWMGEVLFPADHAYGRPIGGTHESLQSFTRGDVAEFVTSHYGLANTTLAVVGDVDDAALRTAFADFYKALGERGEAKDVQREAPPAFRSSPEPPPPPPGWFFRKKAQLASPELWLGWTIPGAYGSFRPYAQVAEQLVEQALGELDTTDPDVADVDVFRSDGIAASVLGVRIALVRGEAPERTAHAALDALGRAIYSAYYDTTGLGEQVPKLQLASMSSLFLSAERPLGRALNIASFAHATGQPGNYPAGWKALGALDAPRLGYFANTYLRPERARVLYVEPDPARPPSVTGIGTRVGSGDKEAGAQPPAPAIAGMVAPLGTEALTTQVLPNGLEVILWPRPGYPVAAAVLGFHGGSALAAPPGVEDLLPRSSRELKFCGGAPSARGISFASFEDADASLDVAAGAASNLSAVLLGLAERNAVYRFERWPTLFDVARAGSSLIADCNPAALAAGRPAFWTAVRDRAVGEHVRSFQVEAQDPRARAAKALIDVLLAETPYRHRLTPDEAQRIGAADLARWFERSRVPENGFLVVVGSFDAAAAAQLAAGWYGTWAPSGLGRLPEPARRLPARPPASAEPVHFEHRAGASQAELTLGCTMPGQDQSRGVVHELLARYLAVRLGDKLRERMGVTYGVATDTREYRAGFSLLTLQSSIENDRLDAALRALRELWSDLGNGRVDPRALGEARWDLARGANDSRSATGLALSVARLRAMGRDPRDIDRYGQQLAAVRAADVSDAFSHCQRSTALGLVGEDQILRAAAKAALEGGLRR
jgi:zinc protease